MKQPRRSTEAGPADPLGDMTLRDIEALANRFGSAVATLREAAAIMRGGGDLQVRTGEPVYGGQGRTGSGHPGEPAPAQPRSTAKPDNLTPEQRAALGQWRQSPARAKLLEELRARDGTNGAEHEPANPAPREDASDG